MVWFHRTPGVAAIVLALFLCFTPQVLATDISDIGFVDQSALGQLGPFVAAQQEFAQYQRGLAQQFQAAIKGKTPAQQQQIYQTFNGQAAQKQRELFGPLLGRAQAAIASVAANRGLSVVVDKTIVIYGGLDITQDVISMLNQPGPGAAARQLAAAVGRGLRRSNAARPAAEGEKSQRRLFGVSSDARRTARSATEGQERRPARADHDELQWSTRRRAKEGVATRD